MKHALTVLAVLAMATPGLGLVTVQWSDFEVGTNYGAGLVGENMVAPTTYGLNTAIKTTGNSSQEYLVPAAVVDVDADGEGWMIADDGGGAFDSTDWDDFIVNTLGGPAPAPNSPLSFIADVRIDADSLGDYDTLKWGPIHNAPNSTFDEWDAIAGDPLGTWAQDFEFLTTEFDAAGQLDFILILSSAFAVNNPFAGNATFYLDNVRLVYEPEPTSVLLLGLGSLFVLRRRR